MTLDRPIYVFLALCLAAVLVLNLSSPILSSPISLSLPTRYFPNVLSYNLHGFFSPAQKPRIITGRSPSSTMSASPKNDQSKVPVGVPVGLARGLTFH